MCGINNKYLGKCKYNMDSTLAKQIKLEQMENNRDNYKETNEFLSHQDVRENKLVWDMR